MEEIGKEKGEVGEIGWRLKRRNSFGKGRRYRRNFKKGGR